MRQLSGLAVGRVIFARDLDRALPSLRRRNWQKNTTSAKLAAQSRCAELLGLRDLEQVRDVPELLRLSRSAPRPETGCAWPSTFDGDAATRNRDSARPRWPSATRPRLARKRDRHGRKSAEDVRARQNDPAEHASEDANENRNVPPLRAARYAHFRCGPCAVNQAWTVSLCRISPRIRDDRPRNERRLWGCGLRGLLRPSPAHLVVSPSSDTTSRAAD